MATHQHRSVSCGNVSSDEDELPLPPGMEIRSLSECSSVSASSQSIAIDSDSQLSVQSVPAAAEAYFRFQQNAAASQLATALRQPAVTNTLANQNSKHRLHAKQLYALASNKDTPAPASAPAPAPPPPPARISSMAASAMCATPTRRRLSSPPNAALARPYDAPLPNTVCDLVKLVNPQLATEPRCPQSLRVFLRVQHADDGTSRLLTVDRQRNCVALHDVEYEAGTQRRAPPKLFGFDQVFTQNDCMTEISAKALKDIVDGVVNGTDGCVFLYGASKQDKLSALIGSPDKQAEVQLGLLPSAIASLFALVNEQKEKSSARFSIRVSAFEIRGRGEQVRDLLADVAKQTDVANSVGPAGYLKQQDISISEGSSLFDNLCELRAPTSEKAAQHFDAALAARSTVLDNDDGDDRTAHTLFTFHVYQYRVEKHGSDSGVSGGRSRLHIFDLGTGCRSRDKQSSALSYTAICNTVLALLNGQRSVPYRDSKLSQLLRDCMSSLTCRYCWLSHVSAAAEHSHDTVHAIQVTAKLQKTKRRLNKKADSSDNGSCDSYGLRRIPRLRSTRALARAARVTNALLQPEVDYSSSSEQSGDTVIFVGGRLNAADSDSDDDRPRVVKSKSSSDMPKRLPANVAKGLATSLQTARIPEEAASHSGSNSSSSNSKRGTPIPIPIPIPASNSSRLTPSRHAAQHYGVLRENEQWIDGPMTNSNATNMATAIPPPLAASQACIGVEFYHTGVEEVWIDGPKVFTRHHDEPSNSSAPPEQATEESNVAVCEKGTQCEEAEDGQATPTSYSSLDRNGMLSDISEHTEQLGVVDVDGDDDDASFMTDRSRAPSVQGSVDVQLQTEQLRSCPASMCTTPVRMLSTRANDQQMRDKTAASGAAKPNVSTSTQAAVLSRPAPAPVSCRNYQPTASAPQPERHTPVHCNGGEILSCIDMQKLKNEHYLPSATRASPVNAPTSLTRPSRHDTDRRNSVDDDRTAVPPTPPPLPPLLTAARAEQEAQMNRTQQQRRSFLSKTPTHFVVNSSSRHSSSSKTPNCRDRDVFEFSPPPGPSTPIGNLDRVAKWLLSLESQQQQRCTQYEQALDVAAAESVVCMPQMRPAQVTRQSAAPSPSPLPSFVSPVHTFAQRDASANNDSGVSELSRASMQNAAHQQHSTLPPPPSFSGTISQSSMHPFAINSVLAQLQTDLAVPVAPSGRPSIAAVADGARETKDADVQTSDDLMLPGVGVRLVPVREAKSRKHGSFLRNVIFSRSSSSKNRKAAAAAAVAAANMSQSIFCGAHGVQTDTESNCGAQVAVQQLSMSVAANVPNASRDTRKCRSPSKETRESVTRASPSKTLTRMFTSPLFGKKKHKHHRRNSSCQPFIPMEVKTSKETHVHVSACHSTAVGSDLSTPISVNTQTSDSHMSIRAPSTSTGSGLSASSGIGSGTSSGVGLGHAGDDVAKKLLQSQSQSQSATEALKYVGYSKLLRSGGTSSGYESAIVRDGEATGSSSHSHNDSTSEGSVAGVMSPFRCAGAQQRIAATPPRMIAQATMQTTAMASLGKAGEQKPSASVLNKPMKR